MILHATTDSLEIVLAGAITTNQLPVVVAYTELDAAAGTATPARTRSASNSTTPATILAAPASGKQRIVDSIVVYNKDTAAATVLLQLNDNSTVAILKRQALAAGESLVWTRAAGWP